MNALIRWRWVVVATAVATVAGAFAGGASAGASGATTRTSSARSASTSLLSNGTPGRYIVQVRSKADLAALQKSLRDTFLGLLGGLPEVKGLPPARVTGVIAADGYRIEKLALNVGRVMKLRILSQPPSGLCLNGSAGKITTR